MTKYLWTVTTVQISGIEALTGHNVLSLSVGDIHLDDQVVKGILIDLDGELTPGQTQLLINYLRTATREKLTECP